MSTKNKPIEYKEIVEKGPIDVIVDGYKATIELTYDFSERVLIKYKTKHPRWDASFQTKYFEFIEPGVMLWGYEDEKMNIIKA